MRDSHAKSIKRTQIHFIGVRTRNAIAIDIYETQEGRPTFIDAGGYESPASARPGQSEGAGGSARTAYRSSRCPSIFLPHAATADEVTSRARRGRELNAWRPILLPTDSRRAIFRKVTLQFEIAAS